MNFKELMLCAKESDAQAVKQLLDMYRPLLLKESIVDSIFDEDLHQEFNLTLLACIKKFRVSNEAWLFMEIGF